MRLIMMRYRINGLSGLFVHLNKYPVELIKIWEYKIMVLSELITAHTNKNEFSGEMLNIMIARKNQLIECMEDFKKQFPNL